jgi:hypothetical protein
MSSFSVQSGDGKLIASWILDLTSNTSGELILNNITASKKSYSTISLNSTDLAVGSKEIVVVNGDVYNIRLLTNNNVNLAALGCVGKSKPERLLAELETRNRALNIKLFNYNPLFI